MAQYLTYFTFELSLRYIYANMKGWKEIEYEVVRDCMDNCITVCNMEVSRSFNINIQIWDHY